MFSRSLSARHGDRMPTAPRAADRSIAIDDASDVSRRAPRLEANISRAHGVGDSGAPIVHTEGGEAFPRGGSDD
jgi:hypothetical protein